jgi:flagellar protein FlgJ
VNAPDVSSQFALDAKALSALREEAKSSPDKALGAASQQFEAVFLQMMLKAMRDATPQDGMLDSSATRMYTSMFDQQIAQTMAKRGTGLAAVIERQLSRAMPHAAATPAGAATATQSAPTTTGATATSAATKVSPAARAAKASPAAGVQGTRRTGTALDTYRRTASPATHASAAKATTATPATTAPKTASASLGQTMVAGIKHFVDTLRPAAEAAAKAVGLPVEYLLAQAGLESGWGKHQPKDAATGASHNVFGIKAGRAWQGKVVEAPTKEVVAGASVPTSARFRAYDSYASSFGDFAKLLRGSRRYAPALAQAADPAAYAKALQRGGYATDPAYAAKLTRAIASVTSYVQASGPSGVQVSAVRADNTNERT